MTNGIFQKQYFSFIPYRAICTNLNIFSELVVDRPLLWGASQGIFVTWKCKIRFSCLIVCKIIQDCRVKLQNDRFLLRECLITCFCSQWFGDFSLLDCVNEYHLWGIPSDYATVLCILIKNKASTCFSNSRSSILQ